MIIHLRGRTRNDICEFDLMNLYFNSNSTVTVTEICIQYDDYVKDLCGSIETTLIERSAANPRQEIVKFAHYQPVKNFLYTPTHLNHYKIQLTDLKTSVFKISHLEQHQTKKIKQISLKLQINEGFLKVNSK